MSNYACKITSSKNLCLAGGVALNCVANGKILSQEGVIISGYNPPLVMLVAL